MAQYKDISTKNPIHFSNERVKALDRARKILIETFEQYEGTHPDKREELNELRGLANEIYLKRKASFLLEDRLSYMNDYLNTALSFALKDHFTNRVSFGDSDVRLFYLKRSNKRFTLNDQSV